MSRALKSHTSDDPPGATGGSSASATVLSASSIRSLHRMQDQVHDHLSELPPKRAKPIGQGSLCLRDRSIAAFSLAISS